MITTLISMYAASALFGAQVPRTDQLPWKDHSLLQADAIAEQNPRNLEPVIKAKAAIAVDLKTGQSLYEKNIHDQLPIASITKLMTTILVLEENKLDEVVTVSKKASTVEGSKMWLAPGEKITIENLLDGALIHSANDAAYALAEYNGGTVADFVNKMNQKALELGLYDTHFTNPIGLDEEGNYSSAYDLATLGRYAYKKSFIHKTTVLKDLEVSSTNGQFTHKLVTTNDLLGSYLKVLGLKTGTTDLAGECFVGIIENDQGNDILTVLLKSPSRYNETKILADWVFRTYRWS